MQAEWRPVHSATTAFMLRLAEVTVSSGPCRYLWLISSRGRVPAGPFHVQATGVLGSPATEQQQK